MITETWHSERVDQDLTLNRWGEIGTPVLLFPTAGGDAGEVDRFGVVASLADLMAAGRIKVYSIDSVAGRAWLNGSDPLHAAWLQNRFDDAVYSEVVPAIRADTGEAPIIAAGASIGAFNAVASVCRHPDAFRAAIGMSGTYDLSPWLGGQWSDDFYYSSPMHYLPGLEGELLDTLRQRFVLLASGTGAHENPGESWHMAEVLGAKGIPNRVDNWPGWTHDWPTWRSMLPTYLDELTR